MSLMVIPLLFKSEHAPTARGPTHPLTNLPVGIVFADFGMLGQTIFIVKFVEAEGTPEGWVDYPIRMTSHMFGNILFKLTCTLTNVADKVPMLMIVLHVCVKAGG